MIIIKIPTCGLHYLDHFAKSATTTKESQKMICLRENMSAYIKVSIKLKIKAK